MIVNITQDLRLNIEGSRNITIEKRVVVKAGRRTKEENIGKERWDFIAHCGRLDHAIDALINKHFRIDLIDKEKELSEFLEEVRVYMDKVNTALSEKIPEIKKDERKRLRSVEYKQSNEAVDGGTASPASVEQDTQTPEPAVEPVEQPRKNSKWARRLRKTKDRA